ncbi:hypothetical protein [Natronococcus pandeyae]|uniref:hypothetical protein n=1 Tax=Natronococcus pandeyae TaxID=2055836 RepID=UPI001652F555|nr:hypothetical protein [Natronococcus pandeyae]
MSGETNRPIVRLPVPTGREMPPDCDPTAILSSPTSVHSPERPLDEPFETTARAPASYY